jgi:hypothetical protein
MSVLLADEDISLADIIDFSLRTPEGSAIRKQYVTKDN